MNLLAESHAFDKLHGDEVRPATLTDFVNVRDVRMIERRGGRRLLFKAAHSIMVSSHLHRQSLQSDFAMEPRILRQVHLAHSAFADFRDDAVVRKCCVDAQRFAHYLWLLYFFRPSYSFAPLIFQ